MYDVTLSSAPDWLWLWWSTQPVAGSRSGCAMLINLTLTDDISLSENQSRDLSFRRVFGQNSVKVSSPYMDHSVSNDVRSRVAGLLEIRFPIKVIVPSTYSNGFEFSSVHCFPHSLLL